ncbi:hypothetical protein Clacol_006597 [Clathrus columnatus]|uniref:SH3 domain-containing protein n=1 Tax=Clathrus columnatus TaxID=1419009 RepID=A0AAV5AHB3_9AGAM|nr:hypothetical protein Clacol_006597 [Clathrus columnatus]
MSLYNREVLGRRHAGIFNRARHPIVHEETTSSSTQVQIGTQAPGIVMHSPANTAAVPLPLIPTPPVHTPVSSPTISESSESESIPSPSSVVALPSSIPSLSPSPSPSPSSLTSDKVAASPSFSPAPVQTAVLSSNDAISDTTSSPSSKGGLSSGAVGAMVTIVVLFLAALTAFIVRKLYIRHRAFKRNTWGAGLVPALQTKRNTIYGGDEKESYPSMQQREKSVPALPPTTTSFANNLNTLTPPPPLYNSVSLTPSSPVKNIVSPIRATPKPDLAVVVRTFVPSLPDELNITTGEHVHILMAYDDGWALCSNIRNEQGVVPLQCLQRGGMATALQLQPQSEFGYGSDQATKRLSSLVSNTNGTY